MPARRPGTGSPPTPVWSARSARSLGLRLRPLDSSRLRRGLRWKTPSCPEISGDPYKVLPARSAALNDKLFLAHEAVRGFLVTLDFLGQFLDSFRIDLLGAIDQFFSGLLVALDDLVETLFGDVVSALTFVLHVPFSTHSRFLWLNRRAAERFRPA